MRRPLGMIVPGVILAAGAPTALGGSWVVPGDDLPAAPTAPRVTADTACVDTERSLVYWLGRKIGGHHQGTVRFAHGYLVRNGTGITGGTFTVDMKSIDVRDIPAHEVEARRNLLTHLAHDEFFAVNRFPTARFDITGLRRRAGDVHVVSGALAIRDTVHNVTFETMASVRAGQPVYARATFSIDRRRWGVRFDGLTSLLRNAIVYSDFQLTIHLVASMEACTAS